VRAEEVWALQPSGWGIDLEFCKAALERHIGDVFGSVSLLYGSEYRRDGKV